MFPRGGDRLDDDVRGGAQHDEQISRAVSVPATPAKDTNSRVGANGGGTYGSAAWPRYATVDPTAGSSVRDLPPP